MEEIILKTPATRGRIVIGEGAAEARLPLLTAGQKNFVLTDGNVYALYRDFFARHFSDAEIFVLPAGEDSKTFENLGAILRKMTEAGLHRSSRLFAVGGGVVGDIGGLAAALYMRGISCVQVATTLLAQVDSSVGGKTAVDLCGVKNVVGAFYQPTESIVDPSFVSTLSPREIKCGMGEIVKYAALDGKLSDALTAGSDRLGDEKFLRDLISPCVRFKAKTVEADEKETGERRCLNVGHTTGHGIELTSGLSHGESVLWGMLFETELAVGRGVCGEQYGGTLLQLIRKAILTPPFACPDFSAATAERAAEKARADKKNADDGEIRMSVAAGYGKWTTLSLPFAEYRASLLALSRKYAAEYARRGDEERGDAGKNRLTVIKVFKDGKTEKGEEKR